MKEKGPKYSIFDNPDKDRFKNIAFRAGPIQYFLGDKGLILTILGNNIVIVIHSIPTSEKIPGTTTQLYRQALGAMEFIANITGEEFEYALVTSDEKMKKWAQDPKKGAGLFNWDEIFQKGNDLIARKSIKPSPK